MVIRNKKNSTDAVESIDEFELHEVSFTKSDSHAQSPPTWFQSLVVFFETLFQWLRKKMLWYEHRKRDFAEDYEIDINDPHSNHQRKYPTNYIRTTKYTVVTFLPKNLFEQFRRVSNIYFAFIIGLQFIPGVSPFIPVTGVLPLAFVLGVSALKEGIEDYYRYKEDKKNNSELYTVVRDGQLIEIPCQEIVAGDVVKVPNGKIFPADLILLSSSFEDGHSYVETANIDGETNLKLRLAVPLTSQSRTIESIWSLRGQIRLELPNEKLYQFKGALQLYKNSPPSPVNIPIRVNSSVDTQEINNNNLNVPASNSPTIAQLPQQPTVPNSTQVASLNTDHLLHRGAKLRNTSWIYGIVVYAGVDTKLFMNQQKVPSKFSTVERHLNQLIILVLSVKLILVVVGVVYGGIFVTENDNLFYAGINGTDYGALQVLKDFVSYLILYNKIVPISLWVTLELAKIGQAKFMEWDIHMAIPKENSKKKSNTATTENVNNNNSLVPVEKDSESSFSLNNLLNTLIGFDMNPMKVKTSSLNEDLGRIQHIFSDKTGTLTENVMKFHTCSINGTIYSDPTGEGVLAAALKNPNTSSIDVESIRNFLQLLLLCNTVVPEVLDEDASNEKSSKIEIDRIVYQAESPDEKALVEAARDNQYILLQRSHEKYTVSILEEEYNFHILAVLPFSSARRRMSIIVEYPDGRIMLLCKGADIVILERLEKAEQSSKLKELTATHLKEFAQTGLRTLVCGQRELPKTEYETWRQIFHDAQTSIRERDEKIERACDLIERDLHMVGATAIDDKLQEEVPETIHYLLEAGISIWVLTGDKQETAVNIGYSSKLLNADMDVIELNARSTEECLQLLQQAASKHFPSLQQQEGELTNLPNLQEPSTKSLAIVIDGQSLQYALDDHGELFIQLAKLCRSVICCRVTPLQKALVVRVVKKHEHRITLAVGDGANDCSMIQEAHVGVGIFGKEGNQAARAADFAIHRFKHLKRLLCVHGRYSYIRTTFLIQYFFYKNFAYTLTMFFYGFYCGGSAQTWFDQWIVVFYNITFTGLPPLVYALFEKDVDEDVIMKHPQLYRHIQKGVLFTRKSFAWWMMIGVWHAAVSFFGTIYLLPNDVLFAQGYSVGLWTISTISSAVCVVLVNLKVGQETRYWNVLVHLSLWGSIFIGYALFFFIFCALYAINPNNMYFEFYYIVQMPDFYFILVLLCAIGLLPELIYQYLQAQIKPYDWQILLEKYHLIEPDPNSATTKCC